MKLTPALMKELGFIKPKNFQMWVKSFPNRPDCDSIKIHQKNLSSYNLKTIVETIVHQENKFAVQDFKEEVRSLFI